MMWYKTGLEMYKGLALTKKETPTMTIPASSYIVIQEQAFIDIAKHISDDRP